MPPKIFRRRRRPAVGHDAVPPAPAHDRSALLRELEVSVPAPERIVGWEAAGGAAPRRDPAGRPRVTMAWRADVPGAGRPDLSV